MAIKMGGFSGSGEKERNEQQTEIVQDKYTGEQFEIERHSDFITILPNIMNPAPQRVLRLRWAFLGALDDRMGAVARHRLIDTAQSWR